MDFNKIAKEWDSDRRIQRAIKISDFILSKCIIEKDTTLLDYGCGTGLISQNFIHHVNRIIGYDTSKSMLEIFNHKFREFGDRVVSVDRLDQFNNEVDIVISSMVFHHIEDINNSFKENYKILKENGELIIVDLDIDDGTFHRDEIGFKGHNGFDRNIFMDELKLNGFKIIQFGDVLKDIKCVDEQLIPYSLFFVQAKKA